MTRRELEKMVLVGIASEASTPAQEPRTSASQTARSQAPLIDRLEFFDADVIFGPRLLEAEKSIIGPPFLTADDVVRELDHYHIKEALLFHSSCKSANDPNGNELLLRAIEKHRGQRSPRLHACWSIVPSSPGTLPSADAIVRSLRVNGLKAVRAFPVNHAYRLDRMGDILSALEERQVPLIVDFGITFPHNDRTDWNALESVLRAHSKLDLILAHPPSRQNEHIFQLMELTSRLHINPAGFRIHQEVTALCRTFGPSAVIYGSHLPYYTAAAALAETIYSDLTTAERKLIAGDTLRAMLERALL